MKKSISSLILVFCTVLAFGRIDSDENKHLFQSESTPDKIQTVIAESSVENELVAIKTEKSHQKMFMVYCFANSCNPYVMCYEPEGGGEITPNDQLDIYDRWEYMNCSD